MSAHTCVCPATPAITEPSTEPVRCSCCGEPLMITCANACNPDHHVIPPRRASKPPRQGEKMPRQYPAKPCAWCDTYFVPTGGRAVFCLDCKAKGITLADLNLAKDFEDPTE